MREVVFRNVSCERREIGSKIVEAVDDVVVREAKLLEHHTDEGGSTCKSHVAV